MKIKAIIVDDSLKSRELLNDYCSNYFSDKIEILDLCDSVDSGILSIKKNNPDLVFLDIEMPDKNGFDLISHFSKVPFEVVFVTGHSDYFLKSLECSALNYIMKPINPLNIKSIIENYASKNSVTETVDRFEIFKSNLNNENKTLVFPNKQGFMVTRMADIIYCESSNSTGKCKIVTTTQTIVISKKIKQMRELLSKIDFLQVSSSHIINRNFFQSYETKEAKLTLQNAVIVKVSESFFTKKQLMKALEN